MHLIFLVIFSSYLYAEPQIYRNEEKGYDILVDIAPVGQNWKQSDIDSYTNQLFTWSETLGTDVKILETLPDTLEWGINKRLSEISVQKNTTYFSRILFDYNYENDTCTHGTVLFTITSDFPLKIKIETIITVRVYMDETEENDTIETSNDTYESKKLGYKGSASADFIGINLSAKKLEDLNDKIYSFASANAQVRKVKKFTKEQEWLLYQALNKYELKKNETYIVSIAVYPKSLPATFSAIIAIITITEIDQANNYRYNFVAYKSTPLEKYSISH